MNDDDTYTSRFEHQTRVAFVLALKRKWNVLIGSKTYKLCRASHAGENGILSISPDLWNEKCFFFPFLSILVEQLARRHKWFFFTRWRARVTIGAHSAIDSIRDTRLYANAKVDQTRLWKWPTEIYYYHRCDDRCQHLFAFRIIYSAGVTYFVFVIFICIFSRKQLKEKLIWLPQNIEASGKCVCVCV